MKKKDARLFDNSRDGESRFGGTALELFCIVALQYLMILITLGIGTPWALCMRERWRTESLVIDGKQVFFDGKGRELFWRYMWWSFLTLITLGIYGWKRAINVRDWMVEHTHFL